MDPSAASNVDPTAANDVLTLKKVSEQGLDLVLGHKAKSWKGATGSVQYKVSLMENLDTLQVCSRHSSLSQRKSLKEYEKNATLCFQAIGHSVTVDFLLKPHRLFGRFTLPRTRQEVYIKPCKKKQQEPCHWLVVRQQ